jgi:hypothetical protein
MSPLFTHLISSYTRFSDCILHSFELRYEVLCKEEWGKKEKEKKS